jgi:hypothetical protein
LSLRLAPVLALALILAACHVQEREVRLPVAFTTHLLPGFRIGDAAATRFGALEWIGGFEIEADVDEVGGLSGLVIRDGDSLLGITDDAWIVAADILRDGEGRPVGLAEGAVEPLRDEFGAVLTHGPRSDTESIDITADGRFAFIVAEGDARLYRAPATPRAIGGLVPMPLPPAADHIRDTRGLETVAAGRPGTALAGAVVAIAEDPPRGSATIPGFIIGGTAPGMFAIVPSDGFSITDGKFTPGGDLVILERDYNLASTRMRLRRIPAADIRDGAEIVPETLFDADRGYQIDNMEGLTVWRDAAGATRLAVISDNNNALMQRTLYLEFRLVD